jgi:plasmid maintenance system antidote protein VapI
MVKIPLKYAKLLGVNKSFLVRVNQGKRRLSLFMAMKLVKAAEEEGEKISLLELRPDLQSLIPYICHRQREDEPRV